MKPTTRDNHRRDASARSRLQRVGLLALALLTACGRSSSRAEPTADGAERRTLASQTVLSDEVLWELGPNVRERVVAVSVMADDERYSAVVDRWPEAVPRLAGTSETLLSLKPGYTFVASFTAAETRALLEQHGAPTHVLDGFTGFADYRRHVADIARLAGDAAAGRALIKDFDREVAALTVTRPKRAVSAVSFNEGTIAGAETTFHDVAELAGYRNLAAARGITGHRSVSLEQLVSWNPEVIIIPCGPPSCEASERALRQRPGLAATRAARTGGVLAIPPHHLYSVGRGMLDAVRALRARHPAAADTSPKDLLPSNPR